ncbi:hypothetical protein QJS04_geneDACA014511 [Acorus gramineus]|uniref:PsbP C-terminal domain-containing protein n=1 Tax=Acorus gramineus TaxID=55184 RepID=A0AAV9AR92_ACOGR|nr:hypothetical protein QJS04_geneDACA014511 [Acorus gramineus]
MASVLHLHIQTSQSPRPSLLNQGHLKNRNPSILCLRNTESKENPCNGELTKTRRREALIQFGFSASLFPSIVLNASAETDLVEELRVYADETNKFQISIPQDWLAGTGQTDSIRSVTAFYPKETSDSNVSVAITGLGPDYTRMESFGAVDAFAESLVTGLDRSWKRPPGVTAKLVNSKAAKGFYYIEYTLQNPGERCRHIFSAIGMANNGWYNRLYTVTGLFMEDESEKYRSTIAKCVSSFRFT